MAAAFSKEVRPSRRLFSLIAETDDAANSGPLPRLKRGQGAASRLLGQIPRPSPPLAERQIVAASQPPSE